VGKKYCEKYTSVLSYNFSRITYFASLQMFEFVEFFFCHLFLQSADIEMVRLLKLLNKCDFDGRYPSLWGSKTEWKKTESMLNTPLLDAVYCSSKFVL